MRLSTAKLVLPLLVGLVFVAPAGAQQGPPTGSPVVTIDPRVKLAEAKAAIDEMTGIEQQISELYAKAEKEGDPAQSQCVYKQLVSVRALLEVSKGAAQSMQQALAEGEDARADYEHRKIKVALSKATDKQAEASACFGEGGQGDVQVSVDTEGGEELIEGIEDGNTDIGTDPPNTTPFE